MAYSFEFLETAREDLVGVLDYLNSVSDGPSAVDSFLAELSREIALACEVPDAFAFSSMPELSMLGYRVMHIKSYVVLFLLFEETIIITNIFHQRQDYARFVVAHHQGVRS